MLKSPTVECSVKTVQSMQIKCKTSGLYSQTQVLKFFHFLKLEKIFQDLKTIERISDCEVLDCCRNECHANGLCTKRYKNISIWNFQFSFSFFFQLNLTRFQDTGNVAVNVGEALLEMAFLAKN